MGIFLKDPAAAIDYAIDWAAGYLGIRTVVASGWSVAPAEPGGIALQAAARSAGRTSATLAGGVPGHVYRITNEVTLSDGAHEERTLTIRCEDR